jgi:hypothetical protein
MFENVGRAAENFAVKLSRRRFFGWTGRGALAVAGALVGLGALPAVAQSRTKAGGKICCLYSYQGRQIANCIAAGSGCPTGPGNLLGSYAVTGCRDCKPGGTIGGPPGGG